MKKTKIPKEISDYMSAMQARSAKARWKKLTPAQRSARMKAVRGAGKQD